MLTAGFFQGVIFYLWKVSVGLFVIKSNKEEGAALISLEEYIAQRKKEDKINEFDVEQRLEYMKICVNYVFEYFNNYLNITEVEEQTALNNERLIKYRKQLQGYETEVQDWLVNIYKEHDK